MLDETRSQLQTSKTTHLRQIEFMEGEELVAQKRSRSEMIQLEDLLGQARREYEMLRIEFEQNMAANEQTAPINREMRHLITSLQNHNGQLKGEVHRYKRKYKEVNGENIKIKLELTAKANSSQARDEAALKLEQEGSSSVKDEPSDGSGGSVKDEIGNSSVKSESEDNEGDSDKAGNKVEKTGDALKKEDSPGVKSEKDAKDAAVKKEIKVEGDLVRELRAQLKKALNDQKEMKLLLDMYKGVPKEQRDKVQLMASEKKIRAELEELKNQMKKLQESKREERKKLADEDALRKIKQLEEQKYELQKQVANQKPPDGQTWGGYRPFVSIFLIVI